MHIFKASVATATTVLIKHFEGRLNMRILSNCSGLVLLLRRLFALGSRRRNASIDDVVILLCECVVCFAFLQLCGARSHPMAHAHYARSHARTTNAVEMSATKRAKTLALGS